MIRENQRLHARRALTLPEALLVAAICFMAALFLIMRLPRGREQARASACLSNLNQIGQSLAYYVESTGAYPVNEPWTAPRAEPGTSVLVKLRDQGNLWGFVDVRGQLEAKENRPSGDRPAVPTGLRCPSDRSAGPATVTSYRATAGAEKEGSTGPFAIGERNVPAAIEAADGLAFTAAFAERLIGTTSGEPGPSDYRLVNECRDLPGETLVSPGADTAWARDAGHDWSRGDWAMTLYQHGITPNSTVSAIATKDRCALMGSSSGHPGLVHLLLLDGSARAWRDSVDARVWRRLGNVSDGVPAAPEANRN